MASDARALASVLFVLSLASSAHAQTASDRETARTLMDEGFARRDKSDHRGALERFEAADALMHVPTTGLEAARERIALGSLIEARELLGAVMRYPTKSGEPAPFGEARMHAQKLDEELGARIPSLRIVLRGVDGAATVTVDGSDVPTATLIAPRRVNPGAHTVLVRSGGRERKEQVTLRERETKEVLLDLTMGTSPALAPTPSPPSPPSPRGDAVDAPATPPNDAEHPPEPSPVPRVMLFGGAAVAGIGVVVGTVAGIMSLSAVSTAKNACVNGTQCPPPTFDEIDRARSLGNVSTAGFVVAGAGALIAVTGYFLGRAAEPTATAGMTPWIGPGSAGVRARF